MLREFVLTVIASETCGVSERGILETGAGVSASPATFFSRCCVWPKIDCFFPRLAGRRFGSGRIDACREHSRTVKADFNDTAEQH